MPNYYYTLTKKSRPVRYIDDGFAQTSSHDHILTNRQNSEEDFVSSSGINQISRLSTVQSTSSSKRKQYIIYGVKEGSDIQYSVLQQLLSRKRKSRYAKLMKRYYGGNNVDDIREYLPTNYKHYADNMELLKEQIVSLHEINLTYCISEVKLAPECQGCLYESMGQRDHMDCDTGCLHDKTQCHICL